MKIHTVISNTGEYGDRVIRTVMTYTHLGAAKAHAKRANGDALAAGVHSDQPHSTFEDRDEYETPYDPHVSVQYTGVCYYVQSFDVADNLADGLAKLAAR